MGNKPSLPLARKNRINGQIDVSSIKEVNLRSDWFGESQNQAIGVTKVRETVVDEFDICWVIKDWSKVCLYSERLVFPQFRGGPLTNHLWSLELEVKNNESIKAYLILKGINGSFKFIEADCEHDLFRHDQERPEPTQPTFHKKKVGQYFCTEWEWSLVEDDTARIHCSVKVKIPFKQELMRHTLMTSEGELLMSPVSPQALASSNGALRQDFGSLFQTKEIADFKLVVGKVNIPAHKAILAARSKVFATMLATQMTENADGKVVIQDFGPKVVNAMLEFIYSGRTVVKGVSTEDLLLIAEKYEIPELVAECESVLISQLTISNAARVLKLAHLVASAVELKSRSIEFIKGNIDEVAKTQEFQELTKTSPELLVEILLWKN